MLRRPPFAAVAAAAVLHGRRSAQRIAARSARSIAATAIGSEVAAFDPLSSTATPAAASSAGPVLLQPRVLIYDGVCHLCHRGVKWVIKADKYEKIKFCCLQSKAAEPYLNLAGVDREDVLRRVLFIEGPEAYYQGATAALKVASYLPFPYSMLASLQLVPAPVREELYDYVACHRYAWFEKDERCIVTREQDHSILERFIDRDELICGSDQHEDDRTS